ncbi:hypothetical protein TWF730_006316 [Orbilia blumenaviensis]|uniref:F-box domain-containing protein n=1 Tax=Orbilia blumenaviensis TaxID=1796055 RepID=A0AAV9VDW1_9PEZI
MSATLETLPIDIKLLILLNIPDYLSLLALTSVSHGFFTTYKHYESLVSTEPLYADALAYENESCFLACYSDVLRRSDGTLKWQKFQKIVSSYLDPERSSWGRDILGRDYRQKFIDGGEETKKSLVDNHRVILQHCEHFINTERFPRLLRDSNATGKSRYSRCNKEKSVSLEERARIVRAFYRLWILVLVYTTQTDGGYGHRPWYTQRDSLHMLLARWGFWEVKEIQIVAMHLREQTRPVFKHFQPNPKELQKHFSGEYLWEGRPYNYPDGIPYGDDKHLRAEYFFQKFHFTAFLLTSFPYTSLPFLKANAPKSVTPNFTALSALVHAATNFAISENTAENTNRIHNCLFFPDRLFDEFRLTAIDTLADISTISKEDTYLVSNSILDPRNPESTKRLCKLEWESTSAYHKYYLKLGPEAALVSWQGLELSNPNSMDSDYYAAIWDDSRLKKWGYQFPTLERPSWDLRRVTDMVTKKFHKLSHRP